MKRIEMWQNLLRSLEDYYKWQSEIISRRLTLEYSFIYLSQLPPAPHREPSGQSREEALLGVCCFLALQRANRGHQVYRSPTFTTPQVYITKFLPNAFRVGSLQGGKGKPHQGLSPLAQAATDAHGRMHLLSSPWHPQPC